jgi:hypothetical protein
LQIDASVYHVDWKNIQQYIVFPCLYGFTSNSGSATSNGFDLSVNMQLTRGLVAGASVGYTNAKYTTTTLAPGSGLIVTADGQTLGQTPWTAFGFAEYTFHFSDGKGAYARLQEKYDSRNSGPFAYQNPNNINYDPYHLPDEAISLLDFRTGLLWGRIDVSLFVDNVLNRTPRLYTIHQVFPNANGGLDSSPLFTSFTERPRTVGVTAVAHF